LLDKFQLISAAIILLIAFESTIVSSLHSDIDDMSIHPVDRIFQISTGCVWLGLNGWFLWCAWTEHYMFTWQVAKILRDSLRLSTRGSAQRLIRKQVANAVMLKEKTSRQRRNSACHGSSANFSHGEKSDLTSCSVLSGGNKSVPSQPLPRGATAQLNGVHAHGSTPELRVPSQSRVSQKAEIQAKARLERQQTRMERQTRRRADETTRRRAGGDASPSGRTGSMSPANNVDGNRVGFKV